MKNPQSFAKQIDYGKMKTKYIHKLQLNIGGEGVGYTIIVYNGCLIVTVIIIAVAFLRKALPQAREIGLSEGVIKKAVHVSGIFSIVPSIPIAPGETDQDVLAHVGKVAPDTQQEVIYYDPPSPVSGADTEEYKGVARAVADAFPEPVVAHTQW